MNLERAVDVVAEYARHHAIPCDQAAIDAVKCFIQALQDPPARLVSDADPLVVARDHIIDSLEALRLGCPFAQANILDLGTGGGFPGVPLLLFAQPRSVTFLDSRHKSAAFVTSLLERLDDSYSTRAVMVRDRAEAAAHRPHLRARFDIVVSRAVAPLPVLLELGAGFLAPDAQLICYKGPLAPEEHQQAAAALRILALQHRDTIDYTRTGSDRRRSLLVYQAIGPRPDAYPRAQGRPAKRPLC